VNPGAQAVVEESYSLWCACNRQLTNSSLFVLSTYLICSSGVGHTSLVVLFCYWGLVCKRVRYSEEGLFCRGTSEIKSHSVVIRAQRMHVFGCTLSPYIAMHSCWPIHGHA
jgi:hypothetical protein